MPPTLRYVLVLIFGHEVAWRLLMASYSLLFVLLDNDAMPRVAYSHDLTIAFLLLVPAIALGLVLPHLFVGTKRIWWCWALSLSLLAYAIITWRIYPATHSTLITYAFRLLAHYAPMAAVGVAATISFRLMRSHVRNGV